MALISIPGKRSRMPSSKAVNRQPAQTSCSTKEIFDTLDDLAASWLSGDYELNIQRQTATHHSETKQPAEARRALEHLSATHTNAAAQMTNENKLKSKPCKTLTMNEGARGKVTVTRQAKPSIPFHSATCAIMGATHLGLIRCHTACLRSFAQNRVSVTYRAPAA